MTEVSTVVKYIPILPAAPNLETLAESRAPRS